MQIRFFIFLFFALFANTAKAQYPLTINILPGADPDTCNYLSFYPSGSAALTGKGVALSYETLSEKLSEHLSKVDTAYVNTGDSLVITFLAGDTLFFEGGIIGSDTDWLRYRTGTIPTNTDTMYHVGVATVGEDSVYTGSNILTGKLNVVGRLDLRFGEVQDYNIMIGRGAGRSAMTGAANIGIGSQSLDAITTGSNNIGIGLGTGSAITTGARNFAMGQNALLLNVTGSDNIAVGNSALNAYTGSRSIGIGVSSLAISETGNDNISIGYQSGANLFSSGFNTIIGSQAGLTTDGASNVFIGYKSGRLNEGSSNIFIGKESGENETGSELLYIDPTNTTTPLIKGDFAADTLRINGSLSVRDVTTGSSTDNTLGWNSSTKKVTIKSDDYLVYTALITQTGTSAPTATVLKNTLGGTVVWSYNGVGDYTATLSGVFTANKTTVTAISNNISTAKEASGVWETTSTIDVYTTDAWDSANDVLNVSFFEIRVYP